MGITIDKTELIESEGTLVTITFTLSESPPEEGVVVQVNGSGEGILQQFDIFAMEIDGGTFPFPTEVFTGFLFKITQQQANITIPVFQDPFEEGLQGFSFSLSEASHYTVDPNAREAAFTIADTPDSIAEVSLSSESGVLIELENATGVLTFNLTANPPAEGITVTVDAPNLSEFDVDALTVTGGEIIEITDSGFLLKITDATATIELPVQEDGTAEGLETAVFTLIDSEGATVNPDTNEATLTLVDNPAQVPVTQEFDFNDTIPQALDLNLNPENLSTTVRGRISSEEPGNEFIPGFGPTNLSDFSEDVDFYKFNVNAGETVKLDVNAVGSFTTLLHPGVEQRLDSELRLFDAEGNELARNNNGAAPGEALSRDPYLEFTASEAGTYYVGVSQLGNRNYDPFVENSGSGWIFPEIGVHVGEYDLNVSLTPGNSPPPTEEATFDFEWTGQVAGFSIEGTFGYDASQTYEDGIVREADLTDFDVSFFDPDGNLLRTYEDNHLTFPEFNFAFDTETQEILQDGYFLGSEGINIGEKTPVGDGFSGLNFWSRPEFNSQGEVPPPHVHIDDWADEFGFPLGFSSHEDVAFFTRTTGELLVTGRLGETYVEAVQDSLDEVGARVRVMAVVDDDILGTDADDTLVGDDGDNLLNGLAGNDTYTGGAGADQFVFAIAQGIDTITDFEVGIDQISLGGLTPAGVKLMELNNNTLVLTNSNELIGVVQGVTGLDSTVFA